MQAFYIHVCDIETEWHGKEYFLSTAVIPSTCTITCNVVNLPTPCGYETCHYNFSMGKALSSLFLFFFYKFFFRAISFEILIHVYEWGGGETKNKSVWIEVR